MIFVKISILFTSTFSAMDLLLVVYMKMKSYIDIENIAMQGKGSHIFNLGPSFYSI